ncbi:peptidase M16 [Taibaiella sp. KBW10]|uniref:M16 family metallopeptidase n=1 Tax=Taibaiella sp. KBW10 TaxID=2153357 RepID=UPI000F59302C|nr:pitrilysin family protein [Taibaiella sp. KBW10]RQO30932.1 peptidase M16 [Taibaiella sp. KBW10]
MINFDKFILANGLRVLVHQDTTTPMVAVNVLYDVGARDEDEAQTGFAHLFEHLMFGGSVNIPDYDEPLQMAGGENNAYTTNDFTNYYIQIPKENMETAFWLESDRMLSLAFSEKSLEVQRKVVSEEFKEHYINKPYGDVWKILRELTYTRHPYKWMTIGKELKHIEDARLPDVKAFFQKHYNPLNAILCVAGDVETETVKAMAEKWFGNIPSGIKYNRNLPLEPQQTEARKATVEADVPLDAFYKTWHIGGRLSDQYHAADIITEVMGSGQASRLYQELVKEKRLFSNIDCYHTGSLEPGIIVIEGKLVAGVAMEAAEAAVTEALDLLKKQGITEEELHKSINRLESMVAFEDMNLLARANNLAFYELLGDAQMMNTEMDRYSQVNIQQVNEAATQIFTEENSNTLYYLAKPK